MLYYFNNELIFIVAEISVLTSDVYLLLYYWMGQEVASFKNMRKGKEF